MKKKIIIGFIAFAIVLGLVEIIWGREAGMMVGFVSSFGIAFALFDYLIYRIAKWAVQRQRKGMRIFGYIVAGYLGICLVISSFLTQFLEPDMPIAVSAVLGIAEICALGFIFYIVRNYGAYEQYEDREIKAKRSPTSPISFEDMDGHDFEHFCADILRSNGYVRVSVTPASGDQGVDVLAEKGGLKFAIQCKKWSYPIGNTAVQEVSAGKSFYKCDVAVVLTNSTFTKGAIELAEATGVLLWDGDKLDELIHSAAAPDKERQERSGTVLGKREYEFTCNRCGHTWYMTGSEIRSAKAANRGVRVLKIKRFGTFSSRKLTNLSTQIAITEPAANYDKCPACGSHSVTKSKA